MTGYKEYIIAFIFLIAFGCQEDDVFLPEINEVTVNSDIYIWRHQQNSWIFAKMKEHYFWNEQLKDSLSYDFSLEPSEFFESMLVEEDRFSYCFYNEEYTRITKGYNLNETISIDTVFMYDNSFGGRKIGYFVYDEFKSESDITDIILKFKRNGLDDLIIDLRDNPGGLVATGIHLASLISENTANNLFCTFRYNHNLTKKLYKETGSKYELFYFKNDSVTRNRNLQLSRIFFLVNNKSASCSELIINCLKPYMEVIVVGETTVGKDVGMYALKNNRYKYVLEPITFRTYNALGDSVPQTGIVPNILVKEKGNQFTPSLDEPYIKSVINYIDRIDFSNSNN